MLSGRKPLSNRPVLFFGPSFPARRDAGPFLKATFLLPQRHDSTLLFLTLVNRSAWQCGPMAASFHGSDRNSELKWLLPKAAKNLSELLLRFVLALAVVATPGAALPANGSDQVSQAEGIAVWQSHRVADHQVPSTDEGHSEVSPPCCDHCDCLDSNVCKVFCPYFVCMTAGSAAFSRHFLFETISRKARSAASTNHSNAQTEFSPEMRPPVLALAI